MPVKKTILDEWKEQLDAFNTDANKTLAEIRQYKAEIAQIKVDILNEIHNGQFIRDDECIVISAPKIIIGNVNKDGSLRTENGEVTLRGTALQFDGAGETGKLKMRATTIEQTAVDPGLDGKEDVVHDTSKIVSQAMAICLDSQHPTTADAGNKGVFFEAPAVTGIRIQSHDGVEVIATPESVERQNKATAMKTALTAAQRDKQDAIADIQLEIVAKLSTLKTTLNQNEVLNQNDQDLTKSNALALDDLAVALKAELPVINNMLTEYATLVSELAEIDRKMRACQDIIDFVGANDNAYKASTGKKLLLQSEKIEIHSKDGDGTWRTNEGAGVDIRANDINLRATVVGTKPNSEVLSPEAAKSRVNIHARNVSVTTADCTDYDFEQNGTLKKAKYPLVGEVSIRSKTVNIESVDYEKEENVADKLKETALTPGGKINMRANKVRVRTVNEKGEAVGRFSVNSQKITLKSVDIAEFPKEAQIDAQGNIQSQSTKGKNKTLTKGSAMLLMSETMNIGKQKDGVISKDIYIISTNKMSVSGKESVVAADGAQLNMQGSGVELHAGNNPIDLAGKSVTVNGESTFVGKMKADDLNAANVSVDGQFSSPFFGDGNKKPTTPPQSPDVKPLDVPDGDDDDDDDAKK